METLERSRVCRLCGKHAGTTIDIFAKRGNHVKTINSILPILVHEMDLLPKHICHPCNYKLQDFHKFYEDCLKTDANLKGQLSWMRGSVEREDIGVPMVQINKFMIKTEPPDYDDQDTTESILHSGNLTNYVQNNCTAYPETIFPSSKIKCSRCGCYCGNGKRVDDKLAKTGAKTRAVRHSNEKNNNGQFASRDTIRRNLFATEIFGDENPRIQTGIPICNIPRGMINNEVAARAMDVSVKLERLNCGQNGDGVVMKLKMADDANKIAARTLRPRKTCVTHLPHAVSAPDVTTKSNSKLRSKEIDGTDSNDVKSVAIKLEASEDFERSLRPRMAAIDYSETKRKNPIARTTDITRKKSSNNRLNTKARRKMDKNLSKYVKSTNFVYPAVAIKVEPEELTESSSFPKTEHNSKTKGPSRNAKGKTSRIMFEEFLKSSTIDKISSERRFNGPKSRVSDLSRAKPMDVLRQRNLPKNRLVYASPFLRSQRGHLTNGKLKKFDSIEEEPKKIQSSNAPRGILLQSIKREKCEISERPQMILKHRDCDMCNCRFASAELYMLHSCYANKRH